MKDKLALAHTDVKDMVAFMRGFKDGKQVVSAAPGGCPLPACRPGCPGTSTVARAGPCAHHSTATHRPRLKPDRCCLALAGAGCGGLVRNASCSGKPSPGIAAGGHFRTHSFDRTIARGLR